MLNLITDAWLPVRRRSGRADTIAPWAVNDRIDTDPVASFAWPRPELNAASLELLIGMLATGLPPAGDPDAAWQWGWSDPPSPETLRTRLDRLTRFFELIADDAPAFLQDLDPLTEAGVSNPARLLFDNPGAQTAKLNTDLFRRRAADDAVLSLPAAAIALYAHQSWCASDGVGYRVALRGGGPLCTLPVLRHRRFGETLWGQVWPAVRVLHREEQDWAASPEKVFAWLAPTQTSRREDDHEPIEADDMHRLHAHWGMPRRIRLLTGPAAGRTCIVTGSQPTTAVVGVRMVNYGNDYASGFAHPHTPTYRQKEGPTHLPVLASARNARIERIAGLLATSKDRLREPAAAMWRLPGRAAAPDAVDPRMHCFGIDADKAKVVGWVDRTIRLPLAGTLAGVNAVTTCLHPLCETLDALCDMVRYAVRNATRQNGAADTARARLAEITEHAILAAWREAAESEEATPRAADTRPDPGIGQPPEPTDPSRSIRAACMRKLQLAALTLFDELAPSAGVEHRDPFARAEARHRLLLDISGRTTRGRNVFIDTLELPVPGDDREPAPVRIAPPPHRDDHSLAATAWRWREELETTAVGARDRALLTHAHTIEQARDIGAAGALADSLREHCDADTAAVIAVALALTRDDSGFTAAYRVGGRGKTQGPALPRPAFQRMLQTPRNRLIEPLRRLLNAIPDRRADRRTLAADIAAWGPRVRLRWTDDYLRCRTEPDLATAYVRT